LLLDIGRLVANGYLDLLAGVARKEICTNLGQTRQIHKRQAEDMWRVDFQVDGLPVDTLVVSCYPGSLVFDFTLYLGEVVESSPGDVKKLSPFLLSSYTRRCMWNMYLISVLLVFVFAGKIDKLENERSPSYDSAATREEVSADNVLEHGGFSRRL
jgi:hypothetical protein